jgi:hypothetical protein
MLSSLSEQSVVVRREPDHEPDYIGAADAFLGKVYFARFAGIG